MKQKSFHILFFVKKNKIKANGDPNNQSFKDYLTTLNLSSDLSLYLNKKVGDDYKTQLTKYILSLEREKATEILQSVNYLLSDIFVKLKIEIN